MLLKELRQNLKFILSYLTSTLRGEMSKEPQRRLGRPPIQVRKIVSLLLCLRNPLLKKLLKICEDDLRIPEKTARHYLYNMVPVSLRLCYLRTIKLKVFLIGFHKTYIFWGKERVHLIGQFPPIFVIPNRLTALLLLLNSLLCFLRNEIILGGLALTSLIIGVTALTFLRAALNKICEHYGIPNVKDRCMCIIHCRYKNKTKILKKRFKKTTQMREIKEYALQELEKIYGKPLEGEFKLYIIDESGAEILPEPADRLYLYSLNKNVLHLKLVRESKSTKGAWTGEFID